MADDNNIFSDYISSDSMQAQIVGEKDDYIHGELFPDIKSDRIKKDTNENKSVNQDKEPDKKPVDPEYEKLRTKSTHAQLFKHIQVEELNHLKIENERVNFLKNAGRVAELKFMDFLYIGYMEKCNLDLIKMVKKLRHRFSPFLGKEELEKVIDALAKEISYVLTGVKEQQKEEIENWKDELQ